MSHSDWPGEEFNTAARPRAQSVAKSTRKADQDGHNDCGDGESEADAIHNGDHHAPFALVNERFARWRVV